MITAIQWMVHWWVLVHSGLCVYLQNLNHQAKNQVAYLREITLVKILLQKIEFSFLFPD
jgi:hypothetical protein